MIAWIGLIAWFFWIGPWATPWIIDFVGPMLWAVIFLVIFFSVCRLVAIIVLYPVILIIKTLRGG